MNVLDLFSGIGGFSLGLERAGMRTVAFCEIDPSCRKVLAKHWPGVPCYQNIQTITGPDLIADGIGPIDLICGGFPCQDISLAGKGAGIEGRRSGLWSDYARIIGEVRPRYVIVENVAALLGRGLDRVLADLAALGFDAEWHCIPASAIGAPHRRDRIWIVAYAQDATWNNSGGGAEGNGANKRGGDRGFEGSSSHMADADSAGLSQWRSIGGRLGKEISRLAGLATERCGCPLPDSDSQPQEWAAKPWCERHPWFAEPNVGRVANGVSGRVDRLKQLGNSIVPQIPEIIGRAIMKSRVSI